jgi:autotransporter translocation and assembly factor TamB
MSASGEALRPGISWNATRAAGVLMVVIIAVIALVFWPSFTPERSVPAAAQGSTGVAAPHQQIVVNGEVCVQCQP